MSLFLVVADSKKTTNNNGQPPPPPQPPSPPPAHGVIINPWDIGSSVDPPGYPRPSGPGGDHDPSEVH